MKQLDEQLETAPTAQAVREMAELRVRNLQAFDELQSLNDTGRFLNQHPLLAANSEFARLRGLLRRDPAEFLRQYRCVADNIDRYRGYLKRPDRKDRRQADRERLAHYQHADRLFGLVLGETELKEQ